jgi:hypothetical protein
MVSQSLILQENQSCWKNPGEIVPQQKRRDERQRTVSLYISVSDPNPDPDPSDSYVFRPPGSGSFYHQAKIVRKTLIPTVV